MTFLFTDIEGSTRLLQELGRDGYGRVHGDHAGIMRKAVAEGHGVEIRTEGDSFFVVFPTPSDALQAAVAVQRRLAAHTWPDGGAIRVRMGLHTGEGILGGDDYLGIEVNRAARIAATGHGGQIVLSDATKALVANTMPGDTVVRDLGLHRLKDFEQPERLHDLVIEDLPHDFPALRSLDVRRTNLPPQRTSFVGREREVAEIAELLLEARLVTLTGPGGTGKTRLALKVAADELERSTDGVFLVDLSSVTDPTLVIPEIARVLGVRETPGRDLADALREDLYDRELLLVLDNLEQLVQAGPVVADLLDAAAGLTVIATSRIALHLSAEREYQVDPLALPEGDRASDAEALATSESVRLFVERAATVRPGFRVTDENAPAVAEIVARLDGLPLALELAASRLRVLSIHALAERLERRLPLLTGGARDVPERQRTLEGAIRWSYEMLAADDQQLFARLSVFSGGWTLEAAESVCGQDLDVLDGLGTLVGDSLVRRKELADGQDRFLMLETIREYAADRARSSGADQLVAIELLHTQIFRDLAEEAEPHLTDEHQVQWFDALEREHDNLRALLDRAEAGAVDVGTALRTASAIWRFWQQRGHLAEGRSRLERLLALPQAQRRDSTRSRALGALGSLAYWQTDYERVATSYEESADIAREVGDPDVLSWALFNLSFVPMLTNDIDASERILMESLATADERDLPLRARIWVGLGYLQIFRGNADGAVEPFERAMAMNRERGDPLALCENLIGMAAVGLLSGDSDGTRTTLREPAAIAARSASPIVVGMVLLPLAMLASIDGKHDHVARLLGAWARIGQEFGIQLPDIAIDRVGDPELEARAALGEQEFERAHAEAFGSSLEEIVAMMTEDQEGIPPGAGR